MAGQTTSGVSRWMPQRYAGVCRRRRGGVYVNKHISKSADCDAFLHGLAAAAAAGTLIRLRRDIYPKVLLDDMSFACHAGDNRLPADGTSKVGGWVLNYWLSWRHYIFWIWRGGSSGWQ